MELSEISSFMLLQERFGWSLPNTPHHLLSSNTRLMIFTLSASILSQSQQLPQWQDPTQLMLIYRQWKTVCIPTDKTATSSLLFCSIAVPLGTPTNMSIQLLSSESLFVSWLPPPVEMQNGIIQSYSVSVQTTAVENATVLTSKWLNITIESLHPYYEYLVGVAAETVGIGPFSYWTISMPESGIFHFSELW